jgi:hypothetical protein
MTDTSPGPGWWLASDGKWYPQRWEYNCFCDFGKGAGPGLSKAVELTRADLAELGQQGWELVNFSVQCEVSIGNGNEFKGQPPTWFSNEGWSIVAFMKRPLSS